MADQRQERRRLRLRKERLRVLDGHDLTQIVGGGAVKVKNKMPNGLLESRYCPDC